MTAMQRLLEIMARLRDPEGGCPWDLQQDFHSIYPYTIEEAYEVADAIEREAMDELRDELGDLLFQVVYHAQMARERSLFDFEAVAQAIADKIVRRHPHVFGDAEERDAASQTASWEAIKAAERAARHGGADGEPGALDDVPVTLPALPRAVKLQRRASRVGFDWPGPEPVFDKVREELDELQAEVEEKAVQRWIEEELGDLLFAVSNLARHLKVDPEQALRRANGKFERRFRGLEARLADEGERPDTVSRDRLEDAYDAAKAADKVEQGRAE